MAMPMAMPPAARSAASEVVLIPRVPIMNMIRRIQRTAVTRLCMKEVRVASAPRRVNTRAMNFLDLRMSQAPMKYRISAKTSLMPNLMKEVFLGRGVPEDFGNLGTLGLQRIRGEPLGDLLGFGRDGLKDME